MYGFNSFGQTEVAPKQSFAAGLLDVAKSAQTGDIDVALAAIEKFRKGQSVRLFDVWVFGPLTMFYAFKGRLSKFERFILFVMGLGTIGYNLRNYQLNKQFELSQNQIPLLPTGDTSIPTGLPSQGIVAPSEGTIIPEGTVF